MKFVLLLTALLSFSPLLGQQPIQERTLISFKAKIALANGSDKLVLMDSLTELVKDRMELGYDSIARSTANFALELDSFDIATYTAARLVWSWANRNGAPDKAVNYFNEFIVEDLSKASDAAKARLYLNGGDGYYFSGQVENSIEVYSQAADFAIKGKDTLLLAISKKYTADAYTRMGKLAEGANLLREVEDIYRQKQDTIRMINAQSSRADLYSMGGFYDLAKTERDAVIDLAEKIDYLPGLLAALINSSIDNDQTEDFSASIENLEMALELAKDSELYDQYEPRIQLKLIENYALTNNTDKAEAIYDLVTQNPERYSSGGFKTRTDRAFSILNFSRGNYNQALRYGQAYLETQEKTQTLENILQAHSNLSKIYQAKGNSKQALFHFNAFTELKDSLLGIQQRRALSYYQTLYETEKRDAQIAAQDSEIEILDAENKIKNQWMIFGGLGLLAIFTILYLLRTQQFVRKKQALQRLFSRSLIQNQEEERTRVARELHDGVGQKLMLLTKKVNESLSDETATLAENTLEELRGISRGLHPSTLRRLGLKSAIESMINEVDKNSNVLLSHDIEDINNNLQSESELHLYRIIQESLNNIVKHSGAGAAEINLKQNADQIVLDIIDNGQGFNVREKINANSLGMKTLLERARILKGNLQIDSKENSGTHICLKLSLN